MKYTYLFFVLCLFSSNLRGQIQFQDHSVVNSSFLSGSLPTSTHSVDLDGDGDIDVLMAVGGKNKIVWYENMDGKGTFDEKKDLISVRYPGAISPTDLDGDGDLDLVVSSFYDANMFWYENMNGRGAFGVANTITTFFAARDMETLDIDGDGDQDLLVAQPSNSNQDISWFENLDGQGNFSASQIIHNGLASGLAAGDIDGDGDQDFVIANMSNYMQWFNNQNGLGDFVPANNLWTAGGITTNYNSITLFDLDGDGDLDLLAASGDLGSGEFFAWYENLDGLGDFAEGQLLPDRAYRPNAIHGADLDGDGDGDILVSNYRSANGTNNAMWFENLNNAGDFLEHDINFENGDLATDIQTADFDGDGDLDVLFETNDKVVWYENKDGQANFGFQKNVSINVDEANHATAADIDGDGDLDLLSASEVDAKIAWYENLDGNGDFGIQQVIKTGIDAETIVYPKDLDGDGDLDILPSTGVNWYENTDGLGSFVAHRVAPIEDLDDVFSMYPADLDNDGDEDILVARKVDGSFSRSTLYYFKNTDGLGNFELFKKIRNDNYNALFVVAVDLNSDDRLDILYRSYDRLVWSKHQDTINNFVYVSTLSSIDTEGMKSFSTGDVDGDGHQDIVIAYEESGRIGWYSNTDGQAAFSEVQLISDETRSVQSAIPGDIDNDGDLDIIATLGIDNKIVWFENTDGQGVFSGEQLVSDAPKFPRSVFLADLDGDQDMDVLTATSTPFAPSEIAWFENQGLQLNKIQGYVKADLGNNDCTAEDTPVPSIMVETSNGTDQLATFTLSNGFFQLFPNEGMFVSRVGVPDYYSSNPDSYNSDFVNLGTIDRIDFCLQANQSINDLSIALYPLTEARPGFMASYQLVCKNVGTTTIDGVVNLDFDNLKMTFSTASQTPSTSSSNALSFQLNSVQPFESRIIDLQFQISNPPTVQGEDTLIFKTQISPIIGDYTEVDNEFTLQQEVVNGYDPNDIQVLEGEQILLEEAGNYLHYIIRFQNTGNAEAINIEVNSTLDPNLDWHSLVMESVSHPHRVELIDGEFLRFIFDNIRLPDSLSNEAESNGFIAYKIKPKTGISPGDIIYNKADIFFDFNPAITTNTVSTEIVVPTGIRNHEGHPFSIYPVPVTDILHIETPNKIRQVEIFDLIGQRLLSYGEENKIDITQLSPGMYYCKTQDNKGNEGIRKFLKR